ATWLSSREQGRRSYGPVPVTSQRGNGKDLSANQAPSAEQARHWAAGADGVREAVGAESCLGRHAQRLKQRRPEIFRRDGIVADRAADLVGGPVDGSAADAGAGQ